MAYYLTRRYRVKGFEDFVKHLVVSPFIARGWGWGWGLGAYAVSSQVGVHDAEKSEWQNKVAFL